MRKLKGALALTIAMGCLLSSTFVYAASFSDIKSTDWAYLHVTALVDKGGIAGYPDGTFKPSGTITNVEFIKTILGSTVGECKPVDKHWASGYMQKAIEEGILRDGELGRSDWDKPMTRQKMAVAIARASEYILKEDIECTKKEEIKASITDYNALCDYCKDYVVDVYGKGIITGYPDNSFGGDRTATRAEASTMIVRLLDASKRVEFKPNKVETGNVKDIIKNIDFDEDIQTATTYTLIKDATPYKMSFGITNGVKWLNSIGLNMKYLMVDGNIVEKMPTIPEPDGLDVSTYKTDITKADYIVSVDSVENTMLLIVNPFKK